MSEKIKSQNSLFLGEEVDKPLPAMLHSSSGDGEDRYICPHCGNVASIDDCGIVGAEPNCLFCNQCNREFSL